MVSLTEENDMKKACTMPPDCCVIIEMEPGVLLGYRRGVLLNEIEALESLTKAAKTSKISLHHARELVVEMNKQFTVPLVNFANTRHDCDDVSLSSKGKEVAVTYWRQFEPVWRDIQEERSRHY
jgi:molybdate transport repressor ModE-like protein